MNTVDGSSQRLLGSRSTDAVMQTIVWVESNEKKCSLLLDILQVQRTTNPDASTMILVMRKLAVEMITKLLEEHHYSVTSMHAGRRQAEREEAMRLFKIGSTPILVATDVVIRGLDILNVKHVINFDLPSNIGFYWERLGRVAIPGQATSFFNEENRPIAPDLLSMLCEFNQEVPGWLKTTTETV